VVSAPTEKGAKPAPAQRRARVSTQSSLTRINLLDLALLASQVIGLALAAFGAIAQLPWVTFSGALLSVVGQLLITVLASPINRALSYVAISRATRVLLLVLLSVMLDLAPALDARPDSDWFPPTREATAQLLVLVAGALCYAATLADQWRARGYRPAGLLWRGLERFGLADSREAPTGTSTALIALIPTALLCCGIPITSASAATPDVLLALALATIAACAVSCVISIIAHARLTRLGDRADRLRALRDALDAYAPEVIIFFSAPASATYALNVWIQTAGAFTSRTLIVSKEAAHLRALEPTDLPVIVASRARDIEYLTVKSAKVVLHPTTANKVYEIMRLRGLSQIFIGHGDSDKVSSYNPYSRVFDEIWVSGQAGIDRYTALGDGFREDQFVIVGRPQLAEIATVALDGSSDTQTPRPTVLYAPTWEGFLEQSNYSSLATMGVAMVRAMLEMPNPPRILFKPHPSSGHRLPAMLAAQDEIARLLESAGSDHAVYQAGTVSLYAAFNSADVMITDISSVLTDFLASHKPYLVTNPRNELLAEFLQAFPSSAAGSIIDADLTNQRGPDFSAAIAQGLEGDEAGRPARVALADYLLGEIKDDPVAAFAQDVAAAVVRAKVRYPEERVVPYPPDEAGDVAPPSDAPSNDFAEPVEVEQ
jgi:CDP-Glycerol:Poly(glycerophosphate) glycerophosphotransferase